TVRLWDTVTGQPLGESLRGHTGEVWSVSFSPDGTRIVSGSLDKTVRLWDAATGQPLGEPLQGHTGGVLSVSFSPDGTRIASGSEDKTIRLWSPVKVQPSPHLEHALPNPAGLLEPTCHHDSNSTPFLLQDDGWMMGPNHRLLFWVPPASRYSFYNPWTSLVIPRGYPELDLSRMAHGTRWSSCR
ncbi:WD40 repeat-like protein, partial [Suillus decipiens]